MSEYIVPVQIGIKADSAKAAEIQVLDIISEPYSRSVFFSIVVGETGLPSVDKLMAVVEAARPFGNGGFGPDGERLGKALRAALADLETTP